MLVELSVIEQRYQAVLAAVQDGWKVVEVSRRLGVSRQSVHKWISRYEQVSMASLADRSHRPIFLPPSDPRRAPGPDLRAIVAEALNVPQLQMDVRTLL